MESIGKGGGKGERQERKPVFPPTACLRENQLHNRCCGSSRWPGLWGFTVCLHHRGVDSRGAELSSVQGIRVPGDLFFYTLKHGIWSVRSQVVLSALQKWSCANNGLWQLW